MITKVKDDNVTPARVFINTGVAVRSIYESGLMVYDCVSQSTSYTLEYFSLDEIDLDYLASSGRVRRHSDPTEEGVGDFDFWIFNWHFITMAAHVAPETIASLRGTKFTVVLVRLRRPAEARPAGRI